MSLNSARHLEPETWGWIFGHGVRRYLPGVLVIEQEPLIKTDVIIGPGGIILAIPKGGLGGISSEHQVVVHHPLHSTRRSK